MVWARMLSEGQEYKAIAQALGTKTWKQCMNKRNNTMENWLAHQKKYKYDDSFLDVLKMYRRKNSSKEPIYDRSKHIERMQKRLEERERQRSSKYQ